METTKHFSKKTAWYVAVHFLNCKKQIIMTKLGTYKNYLLDTISILKANNKKLQLEFKENKDDFIEGQLFAYYDILTILKQQAIAFDIKESELGLSELTENDLIAAMI